MNDTYQQLKTKENISKVRITNSTCIVTGGAGFIGSHLVDALATPALANPNPTLNKRNHVIVLDNLSTGKLANIAHHFCKEDKKVRPHNRERNEVFEKINNNYNYSYNTSNAKTKVNAKANQQSFDSTQANTSKTKEERKEQRDSMLTDTASDSEQVELSSNHVTFIKADITNLALLHNIFQKYKPSYVFHLAAIASVPKSIQDPITTHEVNVTGTLNVLLAAKEVNAKKVIFSSSCAVYGNPPEDALPLKETQKPDPLSPYATSKLMGEQYCSIFSKTYNLPTVSLRYFNVYGPRQDPNGDYAAVIPKFISRIKEGKPLTIYGDGKQTRDFIYVNDVVNSNIALAISNDAHGIFNVGTGEQTSIHSLANTLLSIHRSDLENINYEPNRPSDIHQSFADISKLEKDLQRHDFDVHLDLKNGLIDTAGIDEEEVLIV